MRAYWTRSIPMLATILLGLLAIITVTSVILHPSQAFAASMDGLNYWWGTLFPALLPYYILCGIVFAKRRGDAVGGAASRLFGRLLGVPSRLVKGTLSNLLTGLPAGIEQAVLLRSRGQISRAEAERTLMLAGSAHPLLLLTVVGAALLHSPTAGVFLACVYYLSWIILAFPIRYYDARESSAVGDPVSRTDEPEQDAQLAGPSFGRILGDSVADSLQRLMQLGGLIMMIAVVIRMAQELGALHGDDLAAMAAGLLDIHLGAARIAQTLSGKLPEQLVWLSAMMAWGGAVSHAQLHSLLRGTDIRYSRYLLARLTQAAVSCALVIAGHRLFQGRLTVLTSHTTAYAEAHPAAALPPLSLWPTPAADPQVVLFIVAMLISLWICARVLPRRRHAQE